jgi:cytochrome b561
MNYDTTRYTKTAKILHWLIALGIFGMFALGWFMEGLPKEAPKQMAYDLFAQIHWRDNFCLNFNPHFLAYYAQTARFID